jgi:hypothetical protein
MYWRLAAKIIAIAITSLRKAEPEEDANNGSCFI